MYLLRYIRFIFLGDMNYIEKFLFELDNLEINFLILIEFDLDILSLYWLSLGIWMEER